MTIHLKSIFEFMDIGSASDFTYLTLFYGLLLTIVGVCYTIYPPTKISWNYGVKIKAAMRNDDTFREAASFIATPTILLGICLLSFPFYRL